MARFKLLQGQYYHKEPGGQAGHVLHEAGVNPIVTTEMDLCAKFVNKFERIIDAPPVMVPEERKAAVQELIDDGVWHEDDRTFLNELTSENFARVTRQVEGPSKPLKHGKPSILGGDMTGNFTKAEDAGLKVFCNPAGKFQVTKSTNTKKPLTREPLEDQEAVEAFIEDYLKE